MKPFEKLERELDQWNFDGDEAMLWWRDDDATQHTEALDQLLALSARYDVPLALAVIPKRLSDSLISSLSGNTLVQILQHGYSHKNNAGTDRKKQELTAEVDIDVLIKELSTGKQQLQDSFSDSFVPVLVPPWNRIDQEVTGRLSHLGFLGLSCFQPRSQPEAAQHVWLVNTHLDIINWKQGKSFIGEQQAIDQLIAHLQARREGTADRAEPTGLLTHHLDHDQDCWNFIGRLLAVLDDHPAVTWLSAERVFQSRWREPDRTD